MPVHLGFLTQLKLKGHEDLLLTIGRFLDVPLYRTVMALEAVFVPEPLIYPVTGLTLLRAGVFVLLKPRVNNMPDRLDDGP
jgi:hypothetical protein